MIWADLHTHSMWSDGSQSVLELVQAAERRGLTHLAVCDHDTLEHLKDLRRCAAKSTVRLLLGTEISAYHKASGRKVHLLGYGMDRPELLHQFCEPVRTARNEMTLHSISILSDAGYPLSERQVREDNGFPTVLYKQHIMKSLVKLGKADAIYGDLYKLLFKNNGLCAGDIQYSDCFEAVRAIQEAGGLAVLAHPGQTNVWDLVPALACEGLFGLELYHECHALAEHRMAVYMAKQYGLCLTGGSDTHGTLGSVNSIGSIVAPESALSGALAERFI